MKKSCLKDRLFILLIYFSIYAYLYHAILIIAGGKYSLWTYSGSEVNVGIIGNIFMYGKDFIAMLLFFILLLDSKTYGKKVLILFIGIVNYGAIILTIANNFNIGYILAGFRSYLYFFVTLVWCIDNKKRNNNNNLDRKISKILLFSIYMEFTLVFLQVMLSNSWKYFGSGAYRFSGSFGNSGGLGYYCIGMTIYLIIFNVKSKLISFRKTIVHLGIILLLSIASGMRTAILASTILAIICILNEVYEKLRINKDTICFVFIIILVLSGSTIFKYIVDRIGRGGIMLSGGTRVSIMLNLILNSSVFNMLLGKGIGYGTNAAVNLNLPMSEIYDGTLNTTIGQFGIFGLIVFLSISFRIFKNIYFISKQYKLISLGSILTIILIFVSGNYFEQISMVIISVYSFSLLITESSNDKNTIS